MNFTETLQSLTGKPLSACTNQELYLALLELVRRKSADRVQPVNLRGRAGISGHLFGMLGQAGVSVRMISQSCDDPQGAGYVDSRVRGRVSVACFHAKRRSCGIAEA